ncbi:hypothetical protein D3C76_1516810 [compost metagenome]
MALHAMIGEISSKEDFLNFLSALRKDLAQHNEEWENPTLDSYLEAMEEWIGGMDDLL